MEMEISFPGGKRVDAAFRGFVVETDQPMYAGGDGSAPAPFSLFLVSIGACAGIYVLGFCQKRDIPTEGIRLRQTSVVNPTTRMVIEIHIDILLPADFPAKYAGALIRSAELCSVKKHMEEPPAFLVQTHIAKE